MEPRDIAELKGIVELFAYSVRAFGLISSMNAENMQRQQFGQSMAYSDGDFTAALEECHIDYNGIITTMNQYRY